MVIKVDGYVGDKDLLNIIDRIGANPSTVAIQFKKGHGEVYTFEKYKELLDERGLCEYEDLKHVELRWRYDE